MRNYYLDKIEEKKACASRAHHVAIELNFVAAADIDPEMAKLLFKARDVLREARNLLTNKE